MLDLIMLILPDTLRGVLRIRRFAPCELRKPDVANYEKRLVVHSG